MALFGRKKEIQKTDDVATTKVEKSAPEKKAERAGDHTPVHTDKNESVLMRPRITEKATFSAEKGAYVFEIALSATKRDVFAAVKQLYNVIPIKVNIVPIPRKKRMSRQSRVVGMTSAAKKAYIYVKKGDTIDIT